MLKCNLQNGDVIVKREGEMGIYESKGERIVYANSGQVISSWNDDLTWYDETYNRLDIVKVYRPFQMSKNSDPILRLIFERPKEVVMTVSEIEKKLGITNLKIVK